MQKELILTMDLSLLKYIVDDGFELRRAAFECIDSSLDGCLLQMNPSSFVAPYLISGLDGELVMPCLSFSNIECNVSCGCSTMLNFKVL